MNDDIKPTVEQAQRYQLTACAVQFADVRGELARLRNGKETQAAATEKLTCAVERLTAVVTSYHTDMVEKMAETRASASSAHHRINWLFGIVSVVTAAGIIAAVLGG